MGHMFLEDQSSDTGSLGLTCHTEAAGHLRHRKAMRPSLS